MTTTNFKEQLRFYENIALSEEDIKFMKSDMISKLNKSANNNYKMSNSLYNEIMSSDAHPNVYSILLDNARTFNLTFDRFYKTDDDAVRIDVVEVYKKLLKPNSILYASLSLTCLKLEADECDIKNYKTEAKFIYDTCAGLTIDFLKNCDDKELTYSFINLSEIDWDNFFDFLLDFIETCDVDDEFLWKRIVKNKFLNKKNMCVLLKEKYILMLMYLISVKTKFNGKDKNRIKYFLHFEKVQDEIKKIDLSFYETKVKPILTENCNNIGKTDKEKLFKVFEEKMKNLICGYAYNAEEENLQTSLFPDEETSEGPEKKEDGVSKNMKSNFKKFKNSFSEKLKK